jgi:hypothetical protein
MAIVAPARNSPTIASMVYPRVLKHSTPIIDSAQTATVPIVTGTVRSCSLAPYATKGASVN